MCKSPDGFLWYLEWKLVYVRGNLKMAVKAALLITNLPADFHGDCKIRLIVFILVKNVDRYE